MNSKRKVGLLLVMTTVLVSTQALCNEVSVSQAWKSRSELAAEHLKQPNLDVCDVAVEKAFQNAVGKQSNGLTMYELNIQLGNQAMRAAYTYKEIALNDFVLISLPSRWMAHQSPDSKTLSVVVVDSSCAFDLCINNPFGSAPCGAQQ